MKKFIATVAFLIGFLGVFCFAETIEVSIWTFILGEGVSLLLMCIGAKLANAFEYDD